MKNLAYIQELTARIQDLEEQISYLQFKLSNAYREYQIEVKELVPDIFENLKPD